MTNKKTTKRALVSSIVALMLCFSMLIGTTYAWFTDSVSNESNVIKSGTLGVELWHCNCVDATYGFGYTEEAAEQVDGDTQLFLNKDGESILWEPGAQAGETFRIKNVDTLALKYSFRIKGINATPIADGRDLSDVLGLEVIEFANNEYGTPYAPENGLEYVGVFGEGYVIEGYLLPNETVDYWVGLDWAPTPFDNDFNVDGGLEITFAVDLLATQYTYEKDGFNGDQYDNGASFDDAILANGGTLALNGEINKPLGIDKGADVTLNMDGATLKETLTNKGNLTVNGGTLNNLITNNGSMTLEGSKVDVLTAGYGVRATADSETKMDFATIITNGGGVNAQSGATVEINGGAIVNTAAAGYSTSQRHLVYAANNATVVINDGDFVIENLNLQRSYVCADYGAIVYINGGTFGAAPRHPRWKHPIYTANGGQVIITGGVFGFDPTQWVAAGYHAIQNGTNWYVVPADVNVVVTTPEQLQTAINEAAPNTTISLISGVNYGEVTMQATIAENLTIVGAKGAVVQGIHGVKTATQLKINGLTLKNVAFEGKGLYFDAAGTPWSYVENVTMTGCSFVGTGAADDVIGNRLFDISSDSPGSNQYVNIVIENCTIENAIQGIRLGGLAGEGNVIRNNTITGIGHNAVTLRSVNANGKVLVEENTITDGADRAFRIGTNSGSVTYANNVIVNCGDAEDGSNFKANTLGTVVFNGNTVDGAAWNPLA